MKKIIIILAALALFIPPVFSDTKTWILDFSGGAMDFNMTFYSDYLYGARGDGLRMGGTVSTLDFKQSFTSNNPACLAYQTQPIVSMSYSSSGIMSSDLVKVMGLYDVDKTVKDAFDGILDGSTNDMTKTAGVNMELDSATVLVEQEQGITGFEWMVPFARNNAGFGFAREVKTTVNLDIFINGGNIRALLMDDTNPLVGVTFTASADVLGHADYKLIMTSMGLGRKMTDQWAMGVALDYFESKIRAKGSMTASGTVEGFSDIDDLNGYMAGDLEAYAWGLRVGATFHTPGDIFEAGADFGIMPELKYTGDLSLSYHKFPDEINLLSPEGTVEMTPDMPENIRIKIPSYGRITLAVRPGAVIAFNYTHYFDALSIKYDESTMYAQMTDALRLGFDFAGFQLGGGVIFTKEGSETEDPETKEMKKSHTWFPIPLFSMGCVIPLGTYIDYELEFVAVPLPILKSSVTYKF